MVKDWEDLHGLQTTNCTQKFEKPSFLILMKEEQINASINNYKFYKTHLWPIPRIHNILNKSFERPS